jgi:D-alanyl-D-alanine carboxypeptidase
VDGGKPGYDGASNFVQVISVTRNNHHLIGVTMHTNDWWTDMRDLMNWGFDSFNWVSPYLVDLQHPIPYDTLWNFFVKDKKENTIPTANGGRYYIYTGYSISGPIMTYFDKSGGLKKLGYPIALPKVPDGQTISQQFEHGTIQCNISTTVCQTV